MDQAPHETTTHTPSKRFRLSRGKVRHLLIAGIAGLVVAGILFASYAYNVTPAAIRQPSTAHYHFRLQIIVDGKRTDFTTKAFQVKPLTDICSAELTREPFHFHDGKDQLVHVHWDGMTGGLLLKYYGWNYVGGLHGTLGFRFDKLPKLLNVPIRGNILPAVPDGDRFYVYTGDRHGYTQHTFDDFLHADLQDFFSKKGDFVGNVVIFTQKTRPTPAQIKSRFNALTPLDEGSCEG